MPWTTMSYVLGWKTQSNVYIAADSMITSAPTMIADQSSFGERQIREGGISVAERGMKIVVDNDLAIGLCGDFRIARNLASSVILGNRRLRDPMKAMQEMVVSNGPFTNGCEVQLIIAWRGKPGPRLFCFNDDGSCSLREAACGEGFQLGSAHTMHKNITRQLFKPLVAMERYGPAAHLTAALGLLQSYGIHDYLLRDRVGGSFTGLSVTSEVITWQPDLLFLIDEPEKYIWPGIATCVRDHNLIVNSTITHEPRVFMTTVNGENDFAQWSKRWGKFAKSCITTQLFDFVVLLGLKRWVVIVIEMKRASMSRMLKFQSGSTAADSISWFELHKDMVSALRREFSNVEADARNFRFAFIPFEVPEQ